MHYWRLLSSPINAQPDPPELSMNTCISDFLMHVKEIAKFLGYISYLGNQMVDHHAHVHRARSQ
jgi:hypothetical protein